MKRITPFLLLTVLTPSVYAFINFDSGVHTVDYVISDDVQVNSNATVTFVSGSDVWTLSAKGNSHVYMNGGESEYFWVEDNSRVDYYDGLSSTLSAGDESYVDFNGGILDNDMYAWGNGQIEFSGGYIKSNMITFDSGEIIFSGGEVGGFIRATDNSTIYLEGSNFEVNGAFLEYGAKLSDYGTLVENGDQDYYIGTVTGTMANGSALDNEFYIFNFMGGTADIVIIPEPCTLLLLSLGSIMLRNKR
jgi:hypothetical protein